MPDAIVIADPSRTVRTLVRLAFPDHGGGLREVAEPGDLETALEPGARTLLVVDEGWLAGLATCPLAPGRIAAAVVLAAGDAPGGAWHQALGLPPGQVRSLSRPVSRAAVRAAADEVFGARTTLPAADPAELRDLVEREVRRILGEELRTVVWRVVPELAERLIREELARLLKDEEEGR